MSNGIGEMAGRVWQHLNERGAMPTAKLTKELRTTRNQVDRAVGWLAREDKLKVDGSATSEMLSLK